MIIKKEEDTMTTSRLLGYVGAGLFLLSIIFTFCLTYYSSGYESYRMYSLSPANGGMYFSVSYLLLIGGVIAFVVLDKIEIAGYFAAAAAAHVVFGWSLPFYFTVSQMEYHKATVLLAMFTTAAGAAIIFVGIFLKKTGGKMPAVARQPVTQPVKAADPQPVQQPVVQPVQAADPQPVTQPVQAADSQPVQQPEPQAAANQTVQRAVPRPEGLSDEALIKLKKCKDLFDAGSISQEQYDAVKRKILGL